MSRRVGVSSAPSDAETRSGDRSGERLPLLPASSASMSARMREAAAAESAEMLAEALAARAARRREPGGGEPFALSIRVMGVRLGIERLRFAVSRSTASS